MSFFGKVVDEGDKLSCPTTRRGFHRSVHIAIHKFQKLGSPCRFIFRKRCPLLFVFNASFTHMVQWHFFQIHAIDHFFQLHKAHHVEVAESLVPKRNSFIQTLCHIRTCLSNIDIENIQVLFLSCFRPNNSISIVHLTTILVKLHFQALRNEFANRNEIILHFGNMKNLSDGCKQHSTSNLHCGFDAPFANGLQSGVISHVHLSWNNGFISGEPLSFKCHVLCCTRIDDLIICHMIISTQGNNKHLFLIFTSLVFFFFFFLIILLLKIIPHKMSKFFAIKTKLFVCLMNFVKQCNIFGIFIFFSFGNLMKQSIDDESKVNIFRGHELQTCDQVIKRWGKAHKKYHVHVFIFNLHFNGTQLIRKGLHHVDVRKQVFPFLHFDGEKPLSKKQHVFDGFGFLHTVKCLSNAFDIFVILNVCKLCIREMFTKKCKCPCRLFVVIRDLIFIVWNYCTPIIKLLKPMLRKYHMHLELPKVKVATIKLFHDF